MGPKYIPGISIPPLGAPDEDVKAYMVRHFNKNSIVRKWFMKRCALNLWAYLGDHWKKAGNMNLRAGNGTYVLENVDWLSGLPFPRSTDNLIAEGVDNMVTRLGRKEYVANIRPSKREPRYEAAAKAAKGIIEHDLEKMLWADKREASDFDLVVTGTAIGRAFRDETQTEQMALASPDAAICPSCEQKFASRNIPAEFASMGMVMQGDDVLPMYHSETMRPVETEEEGRPAEVAMGYCPSCEIPSELREYEPNIDEVVNQDLFGRQMGLLVPKGESLIDIISPHWFYPQNGGLVEMDECTVWGVKRPRELEWLYSRHPECQEYASPDASNELIKDHPIFGDEAFSSAGISAEDIYPNHCAEYELIIEPRPLPGLENGRRLLAIGDGVQRVVKNEPLTEDVEGPDGPRPVSKVRFSAARQKRVPGVFWGWSRVDDALPLNRQLNMLDSMDMDIIQKGFPRIVLKEGEEITEQRTQGGAFSYLVISSDDQDFNLNNRIFAPRGSSGEAYYKKRDQLQASIRNKLGPSSFEGADVENPPSVNTVGQLEILARSADENRSQIDRGRRRMHDALFTAVMEMTWAFQKDDREFEKKTDAGDFEFDSYKGEDLLGQCKVKTEARGDYDRTIFQQAAVERGYTTGMYGDPVTMPQAIKEEIRDLMGLPQVDTAQSIQVTRANQTWSEFIRSGIVPVIDPTINDPSIWFQILGLRWEQDDSLSMRRQAEWDHILALIPAEGWERRLEQATQLDMQQRAVYEGQDPSQWQAIHQQASSLREQIPPDPTGQAPPAPMVPPPPQNGFLPESMTDRIKIIWQGMLGPMWPSGVDRFHGIPEEGLQKEAKSAVVRDKLIRMYAVIQTFRKLSASVAVQGIAPPQGTEPTPMPQESQVA
jgi:hypothetical protein